MTFKIEKYIIYVKGEIKLSNSDIELKRRFADARGHRNIIDKVYKNIEKISRQKNIYMLR